LGARPLSGPAKDPHLVRTSGESTFVSTGQSFTSTVVMKRFVVPKTYDTGFKVGLLSKDATTAAELSADLGCDTPLIRLTDKRWIEARDALGAEEHNSKAILAWQKVR
jgi:3-hydroxyisobutyrate dehydrogenase